jgi:thioredoxin reductase
MNAEKNNKRIMIIGAGEEAGIEAAKKLHELYNDVELITPKEAQERGIIINDTYTIKELPIIDMGFTPPETRAERRAKARKERKRK